MKYTLLIGCILLTGCDKLMPSLIQSHNAAPMTLLIAGQSNALHFGWWGTRALQIKFPGLNVVNCAEAATTVEQWSVGGTRWQGCINQLHGQTPAIIFWMQGESNAFGGDQSQFAQKTIAIFSGFHALSPRAKIVFSQLGPNNEGAAYPAWQVIQDAQATISFPNTAMVTAKDLETDPNGIHLTPAAMGTLGARVAEEL